jgi:hypothetical protein
MRGAQSGLAHRRPPVGNGSLTADQASRHTCAHRTSAQRVEGRGKESDDKGSGETPGPDDAETLVERLVRAGIVVRAPLVGDVLRGHRPAVSGRTVERRFRAATCGAIALDLDQRLTS